MTTNNEYSIISRKADGTVDKTWTAVLIEQNHFLYVFKGVFEKEISHPLLGVIRAGTVSFEYYWTNRWYNIFRFHEPGGELRNFYCNINKPPVLKGKILDYVDLDIDVLVCRNLAFNVVDVEEYKENAEKYNYSTELRLKVDNSLKEILFLIRNKLFPFDYEIK